MSIGIRLRKEVVVDLSEAATWYEQRRPGLGREFASAAFAVIELIPQRPAAFPKVYKTFQRALMKRFPYAIYFRRERDVIVVFAVVHSAKRPSAWKRRLR